MVEVANSRTSIVRAHSVMEFRDVAAFGAGLALWASFAFLAALVVVGVVAMNQPEGAIPARFGEEMLAQVDEVMKQSIDGGAGQALGAGIVGPVNDERLAHDIFARNEAPVAAV